MKNIIPILLIFTFSIQVCHSQNYDFYGSISRQTLENFLERAVSMQGLSEEELIECDPNVNSCERNEDIDMIIDIGAKFIGRLGGWWSNGHVQSVIARTGINVADIKARDPQIICQAAIYEHVNPFVSSWPIPDYVFIAFGETPVDRNFIYEDMLYLDGHNVEIFNSYGSAPDISRQETQFWFYYLATQFIDQGIEALHLGQMEMMNDNDPGNRNLWELTQKIRDYAADKNRGVVLLDAHLPSGGLYYTPPISIPETIPGDDVKPQIVFEESRILIFDFHSFPVKYEENLDVNCTTNKQPVHLRPAGDNMYLRSKGGINPQGWSCNNNPYLVEIDNSTAEPPWGCTELAHLWGWDEISWFGNQSENYRNNIITYSYFKIKCMDINGHFQFQGRRTFTHKTSLETIDYRAITGVHNQQETIKNIWEENITPSPSVWELENFTNTKVQSPPDDHNVQSDLVFVGDNRIYYIGSDNLIHGYIKNGNNWLTVSPSYAAGNTSQQEPAKKGGLIANPSGTFLYYVGQDDYVYQLEIVSNWIYNYEAMPTNDLMEQQNIRVSGDMVCATDNQIYYVATELANNNRKRIHGFVISGGNWTTTSPAHSAGDVANQEEAIGDLAVNPDASFIIYRGEDGYFYKFDINSIWNFSYSAMSTNTAMEQQFIRASGKIICPTNNRIYYIAKESDLKDRIHGLLLYNGTWETISPSHNDGIGDPITALNSTDLVCSPDNKLLIYVGTDNQLHGFQIISDWTYNYFNFPVIQNSSNQNDFGQFAFNSNDLVHFIYDNDVYTFKEGEADHCQNYILDVVERNVFREEDVPQQRQATANKSNEKRSSEDELRVFPNPTTDFITLEFTAIQRDEFVSIQIFNLNGQLAHQVTNLSSGDTELKINLGQLANGVYQLSMVRGNKKITKKIIVMQT